MNNDDESLVKSAANRLSDAQAKLVPCSPVRDIIPKDRVDLAYRVQEHLTKENLAAGRRLVGRKIGLTSPAVQDQLGVNQPDYGMLYHDMDMPLGSPIYVSKLMQPKIEAEIAFILSENLDSDCLTSADILASVDYAVAALEIVGSRIRDWDITIADTIADNASSGAFVLGHQIRRMSEIDVVNCSMNMTVSMLDEKIKTVSTGAGRDCMGSPISAALWLARTMAQAGRPLSKGDIVLSGALGPMSAVAAGQRFNATIDGLGSVHADFV